MTLTVIVGATAFLLGALFMALAVFIARSAPGERRSRARKPSQVAPSGKVSPTDRARVLEGLDTSSLEVSSSLEDVNARGRAHRLRRDTSSNSPRRCVLPAWHYITEAGYHHILIDCMIFLISEMRIVYLPAVALDVTATPGCHSNVVEYLALIISHRVSPLSLFVELIAHQTC